MKLLKRCIYPECVISSWNALVFLLDAEIERRVHVNVEKKSNVYAKYKLQEKASSHHMQICVSWKQFLSADRLFTVDFAVNFQTKAEKPSLSYDYPQPLVLSYVWIPMCCVVFRWDNRRLCRSANDNLPFQSKMSFFACFPSEFLALVCLSWAKWQRTQQRSM